VNLPAHVVAARDQNHAILAETVSLVRAHLAHCTGVDCPGDAVASAISMSKRDGVEVLLQVALCELARQPAPPNTLEGVDTDG
jgi:hypothetical protein